MPKFCIECGESLPGKAKFCSECGTRQSSAGGGQSVSVGRDVGRDVVTAGRDVVISQEKGELKDCQFCDGKGWIETSNECPHCGGMGLFIAPEPGPNGEIDLDEINAEIKWAIEHDLYCDHCRRTGRVLKPCSACNGQGKVRT